MFARVSPISLPMSLHATRVTHHLRDRSGERTGVSRTNETLRRQQLRHTADTGCDRRQPASHRFEQCAREPFREGRQDEQMCGIQRLTDARGIALSEELDSIGNTERGTLSLIISEEPASPDDAKGDACPEATKLLQRVEQNADALVRLIQPSDRDKHELR
jgi:hypothetical protein